MDLRIVVVTMASRRLSRRGLHSSIENDQRYHWPGLHANEAENGRFWPFCPSKWTILQFFEKLTLGNL